MKLSFNSNKKKRQLSGSVNTRDAKLAASWISPRGIDRVSPQTPDFSLHHHKSIKFHMREKNIAG